ncbi:MULTISPECIES: hypothetical protein [unclassified Rhodococcus (in: high G+C Gram-positive bacteria)]|uniref:hypothetical protein n=1 Tax=unclassified Rhodococcus (in: high G+C Gram-positive bacteria) TaxID=192944 RepID=UPI00215B81F7|nr:MULTISPECIES: hypothetical protein [unclassified Rhodococcus (in: high G+C Gram-positive bacteria)]
MAGGTRRAHVAPRTRRAAGGCDLRGAARRDSRAVHLRHLDATSSTELIDEELALNAVTAALALAELIAAHIAEVGPGEHSTPSSYTQAEIAPGEHLRHPQTLRAAFPIGTASPEAPVVI